MWFCPTCGKQINPGAPKCNHCGQQFAPSNLTPPPNLPFKLKPPKSLGTKLLWVSGVMIVFFWLIFDTSVAVYGPYGPRVVNEGLQQDRIVGLIVGIVIGAYGVYLNHSQKP